MPGPLLEPATATAEPPHQPHADSERQLAGTCIYFGRHEQQVGAPPAWFHNPFRDSVHAHPTRHWSELDFFDPELGDIKTIWEISRASWALTFARGYRITGNPAYLAAIRDWLQDWQRHNPVNAGPNWQCGQEVAIRLLHLLLTLRLCGDGLRPTTQFTVLVRAHCRRISLTMDHAVALNNSHTISEAVGLYVGASWLSTQKQPSRQACQARRWQRRGRRLLTRAIQRTFAPDGSFAQKSVGYHRLALDMLCQAELWRRWTGQPPFTQRALATVGAGTLWLHELTDPHHGDAPNLGQNDGSLLFELADTGYRDFRPTLQLAAQLFLGAPLYPAGNWDPPWQWLELTPADRRPYTRRSRLFPNGGLVTLHSERAWALVCLARHSFRPAHADPLHLDLWIDGINVLRDGGSYSYECRDERQRYFPGTASHNTVQFDDQDAMPRVARFLFGDWLSTADETGPLEDTQGIRFAASCRHQGGGMHRREILATNSGWTITDTLESATQDMTLRWRLAPEVDWRLDGARCLSDIAAIESMASTKPTLAQGEESRHYLEMNALPVLELKLPPGKHRIVTRIVPGSA